MSVEVCTEPADLTTGSGDNDLDHIVCCDPNRALCGLDVTYVDWVEESAEEDECVVCVDLWSLPKTSCGKPFCRLRQRWRDWRGL